jgi:hypothetical protein
MAQTTTDLIVNVNTDQAAKSIGSLKTQLKQAQAEVVALSDKFGATSAEAVNAAKKAAELRDKIGDAKALTEAFNPDAKFKALTSSLAGVAGGFAAVQGAMSLFGSESEDLQKTLVKVQSAMALSQGLQAVGESIDSFKQLGAVIRTQVVSAFATLRGAIIATGVGALAVGVGLLIANFEKVKKVINDLFPSLGEFADKVKLIVQGFTDFIGVTSQAKRNADALTEATNAYIKSADRIIKELESQEGKEKEIYEAKRDRIQKQLSLIKGATAEELQTIADLNTEIKVLDNQEAKRLKKKAEDEEAARKKEQADLIAANEAKAKSISDYEKFDTELQQRLMEIDKERADKKRELAYQEMQNLITDIDFENDLLDNDFEADQQRLANKEAYLAEQKAIELSNLELDENQRFEIITKYANLERQLDKEITDSKKQQREEELKADRELQEAKFEIAQSGLALLASLAGDNEKLANIIFAISKALEIGRIITTTAGAIAEVTANTAAIPAILPPGVPNPAFPPAVAIGAKKIAALKIGAAASIATIAASSIAKFKTGSGGAGSVQGGFAETAQAPIVPQLPAAQTTNISRQSINDLGNQAVRAYVIETDVTGNQQRMAAIKQRARFS